MELQVQDLINSIKKEGVDAAQEKAAAIISDAEKKAAEIIENAKSEAASISSEAEARIATIKNGAMENAKQAQRDAILSFKESIEGEFKKILSKDIGKTLNSDALAKLIKAVLTDQNPSDYVAEVAEITEGLKSELANEIKNGLEIKVSNEVRSGFKLAAADGSSYFDCTDEEIANMLQPFFSDLKF